MRIDPICSWFSLMSDLTPAASALVAHGDRILLVRSTRTQKYWAFPGGKSEQGENAADTAVREVKEEVGLSVTLTRELGKYRMESSGFEITCFASTSPSLELTLDAGEILEAKWCTLEEALQLDLISTVRDALLEFRRTAS